MERLRFVRPLPERGARARRAWDETAEGVASPVLVLLPPPTLTEMHLGPAAPPLPVPAIFSDNGVHEPKTVCGGGVV